jgi:hypothetical protein
MSDVRPHVVSILLTGLLCVSAAGPTLASQRSQKHKPAVKQEEPVSPVKAQEMEPPPKPPDPPTLEQLPASPPQVSYKNGELTIVAHNSTLGDILRAVHAETGAMMDVPGNPTERVVSTFGPGPPRDVLAKLLNGTHFNYVMLGSATNSNALARVILTPKPPPMPEQTAQNQTAMGQPVMSQPRPFSPRMQEGYGMNPQQDMSDDEPDDSGSDAQSGEDYSQPENQASQPDSRPVIKTPEQLLLELQRQQQELQRQQQQQQAPGNAPATPKRDR